MTAAGMTFTDCNGNTIEMKSGSVVVTTDLFKVEGNAEFTGTVTGDTSGSAVGLTTHTHNQPNDSHGDTEEPTDPPNPGT
jgi:phage baseplate assembly protein gpV